MNKQPTPTPAPTEDARWLSPEARRGIAQDNLLGPRPYSHAIESLLAHAQLMDERQQQTWLAFTVERDLHNAAKKEIAAKDREIAELRKDRERLDWLGNEVDREMNSRSPYVLSLFRRNVPVTREAIDAVMKETNAGKDSTT